MAKPKGKGRFTIPSEHEAGDRESTTPPSLSKSSVFRRYQEEKQKKTKDSHDAVQEGTAACDTYKNTENAMQSAPSVSDSDTRVCANIVTGVGDQQEGIASVSREPQPQTLQPKALKGANFAESFSYLKKTEFYDEPPERRGGESSAAEQTPKFKANSIIVNPRQRGNPILKHIRNVPWEYGDIIPDYVMGQTMCALFLSLRYYNFNPDYIHERLKQLGNRYELRILLVQVDVKDCQHVLRELGKIAILSDCTLILSWSPEECGRYLETYKSYEHKPSDVLQERVEGDYLSKMTDCLTSVKSINRSDVITLLSTFGSLKNITNASKDELSLCPGFGPQKADRLRKIFQEPFKKKKRKSVGDGGNKRESDPKGKECS